MNVFISYCYRYYTLCLLHIQLANIYKKCFHGEFSHPHHPVLRARHCLLIQEEKKKARLVSGGDTQIKRASQTACKIQTGDSCGINDVAVLSKGQTLSNT